VALAAFSCAALARAAGNGSPPHESDGQWGSLGSPAESDDEDALPRPSERAVLPPLGGEYRFMGGLGLGRGIRFQNPYRLQTELGDDAESLSLTATYVDVSVAALFAGGQTIFHGATAHVSFALDGVTQEVITPSYLFLWLPAPRWGVTARAGLPIVVEPDANAGFELAGGGIFYLTAGIGVTASLVGSLFFSAATLESSRSAIPILSMEAGLVYDYEVLP
jgi:hypothetical protein